MTTKLIEIKIKKDYADIIKQSNENNKFHFYEKRKIITIKNIYIYTYIQFILKQHW